jgi:Protein of unknown function (DUF2852)
MALILLILGLVWWLPIGLVILTAFILSRAIGCWRRPQFAGGVPAGGWGDTGSRWESRTVDQPRNKRGSGPGIWRDQTSSNNRAFDDYRAETLRRLEEEQREFKEFLERLRFAKDRAELDQFLNERRDRPRLEGTQSQS